MTKFRTVLMVFTLLISFIPSQVWACACGCGLFDVGTSSMFPTSQGGMVWLAYDFMDQGQNFSGTAATAASANSDKNITTNFLTFGGQYMFNQDWGVQVEVPYWFRYFQTDIGTPGAPDVVSFNHSALGDMRLKGIYTGLADDMSTGITFGIKLPTGDDLYPNFDQDTEIGSSSTDLLFGMYHFGKITSDYKLSWFGEFQFQVPFVFYNQDYYPGAEVDASLGVYYNGWTFGQGDKKIAPILQVLNSYRAPDHGADAALTATGGVSSGYERILIAPGVEADVSSHIRLYADLEFPIYQYFNGDQLAASILVKSALTYMF